MSIPVAMNRPESISNVKNLVMEVSKLVILKKPINSICHFDNPILSYAEHRKWADSKYVFVFT